MPNFHELMQAMGQSMNGMRPQGAGGAGVPGMNVPSIPQNNPGTGGGQMAYTSVPPTGVMPPNPAAGGAGMGPMGPGSLGAQPGFPTMGPKLPPGFQSQPNAAGPGSDAGFVHAGHLPGSMQPPMGYHPLPGNPAPRPMNPAAAGQLAATMGGFFGGGRPRY